MRQEFEKILGEEFRYLAIKTRGRLGLTQKEMGERLQMKAHILILKQDAHHVEFSLQFYF